MISETLIHVRMTSAGSHVSCRDCSTPSEPRIATRCLGKNNFCKTNPFFILSGKFRFQDFRQRLGKTSLRTLRLCSHVHHGGQRAILGYCVQKIKAYFVQEYVPPQKNVAKTTNSRLKIGLFCVCQFGPHVNPISVQNNSALNLNEKTEPEIDILNTVGIYYQLVIKIKTPLENKIMLACQHSSLNPYFGREEINAYLVHFWTNYSFSHNTQWYQR